MKNFVKILRQIKKFPMQALDSDFLVCMAAICYSSPTSADPTYKQLLSEERIGAKFQIDSIKTEGLVRIYTDRRTDRQTDGHG